jgi:hypothetical protein
MHTPAKQIIAANTSAIVTPANAKFEIEKRMAELVDLLAVFAVDTELDPRAWSRLLIYAPQSDDRTNESPDATEA